MVLIKQNCFFPLQHLTSLLLACLASSLGKIAYTCVQAFILAGRTGLDPLPHLVEPRNELAVDPFTLLSRPIDVGVETLAVLPTVPPLAVVLTAVGPRHHPVPLLLVRLKLARVDSAISVSENSGSVHLVGMPLTFVLPSIWPRISASSLYIVVFEGANVN